MPSRAVEVTFELFPLMLVFLMLLYHATPGYPIMPTERVECSNCHVPAQKEAWNRWVSSQKTCPWCGTMQNPVR